MQTLIEKNRFSKLTKIFLTYCFGIYSQTLHSENVWKSYESVQIGLWIDIGISN